MPLRRLLALAILALSTGSSGCAAYKEWISDTFDRSHYFASDEHPWHSTTAKGLATMVAVPVAIAVLPLTPFEYLITGENPIARSDPGYLFHTAFGIGNLVGAAGAFPVFVLGLPWEFSVNEAEDESADERTPP